MKHRIPMVGRRFSFLEVIDFLEPTRGGDSKWVCVCDCGGLSVADGGNLRRGNTVSCGCWRKALSTTHGMSKSRTYHIWQGMHKRCNPRRTKEYPGYAGRGIRVCKRWLSFERFLTDMGEAPEGLTLERIDTSRGYSPANCVWASYKTQARNKRNNRKVWFEGQLLSLMDACERAGVNYSKAIKRLQRAKDITDLFGEQK